MSVWARMWTPVWLLLLMLSQPVHASRIDTIHALPDDPRYEELGIRHRLCIYVPDAYTGAEPLPVLYLLHGIHGNQYMWQSNGRVQEQMDSLIGIGQMEPTLIVMPFCQIADTSDRLEPGSLWRCCVHYPQIKRGRFEQSFGQVETYVETHYNVRQDREGRMIAGLSCGARQAANIAKNGNYGRCGLFSPIITREQLPAKDEKDTRYWVGGGKTDVFLVQAKRFDRRLKKNGNNSTLYIGGGGHNWRTWQLFIVEFMKAPNGQ